MRDWIAVELAAATGAAVAKEQFVPELCTPERAAKLDVVGADPASGRPVCVDVAVTHAHSADPARLRPRLARDGLAAAAEEADKRRRYPTERAGFVSPFVLETGGRAGAEAETLVRSMLHGLSAAERERHVQQSCGDGAPQHCRSAMLT